MSGRRRAGDEFDDERAWPADRQPRGYRRPRDAGIADRTPPPWQAVPDYGPGAGDYGPGAGDYGPDPGEYGPGPGGPPPGARRGRHSAPSGPPSMPDAPYSRPAYREQDVPPPADPREQYDDPAARYPVRGGGYPAGSSRYPDEAGRGPGRYDGYPASGDPYPSPGDRYARPADPYQVPDDRYPAPGDRYQGPGDRYHEPRDQYFPASGGYPEDRGGPARRAAYPEPGDQPPGGRERAGEFGAGYPSPRDQRSDPDGYPPARDPGDGYPPDGGLRRGRDNGYSPDGGLRRGRDNGYSPDSGLRPGRDNGYPPARGRQPGPADGYPADGGLDPPGPVAGRPGRGDEYPAARDSYPGRGDGYGGPGSHDAAADARLGDGPARDGYGDRDDPGTRGGRDREDDYDFWDGADDRPARPKRRRGRFAGGLAVLGILAIIVPLAVGGFYAYRAISAHFFPADYSGAGTGNVTVEIQPGDTATTVGDRLYALGVVASARAFVNAAEHSQKGNALQPGFYRLHKHMNATLAFNLLLKPSSRIQLKVTIPEGLRESQIIAVLGHGSGIPLSEYKQALRNTAALGLPSYAHGNPEGYLFPATYDIQPGMSATDVLKAMVKAFDQEAASINLRQAAARGHLTEAQAIVVASLAQAEGGKVSDFPKIARVIYNRLAAGMPLQLDSTVLYALHRYGILATDQQLTVKSPYNTYRYKGLPPGPIDSPGAAAIHAALHPASGSWLYFVTVNPKTKQTVFTSSLAKFNQLRQQLQQNLGQGG